MNIRTNYYYLLRKGFKYEELKNMEHHEFHYYINLYEEEIEEANKKAATQYQR